LEDIFIKIFSWELVLQKYTKLSKEGTGKTQKSSYDRYKNLFGNPEVNDLLKYL
jgi:hypothetical protein